VVAAGQHLVTQKRPHCSTHHPRGRENGAEQRGLVLSRDCQFTPACIRWGYKLGGNDTLAGTADGIGTGERVIQPFELSRGMSGPTPDGTEPEINLHDGGGSQAQGRETLSGVLVQLFGDIVDI
jgi:hypothetical protein